MASDRGPTTIAIVAGAAVGAVAAMLARGPEGDQAPMASARASAEAPVVPVPTPVAAPRAPEALPAKPVEVVRDAAAPAPKLDDVPLAQAELGCARRVPRSCLGAGRAYAEGRGIAVDAAKARLYRVMAVSMYEEQCTARDPESCQELATIYASGLVASPYPEAPAALFARTRELCSGKTSAFCSQLTR